MRKKKKKKAKNKKGKNSQPRKLCIEIDVPNCDHGSVPVRRGARRSPSRSPTSIEKASISSDRPGDWTRKSFTANDHSSGPFGSGGSAFVCLSFYFILGLRAVAAFWGGVLRAAVIRRCLDDTVHTPTYVCGLFLLVTSPLFVATSSGSSLIESLDSAEPAKAHYH